MTSKSNVVARVALAVTLLSAVWTILLVIVGGFDTNVFGIRIRTNDPYRPLVLSFLAVMTFVAALKDEESDAAMSRLLELSAQMLRRLDLRLLSAGIALAVALVGIMWGARVAGGSDSYGYLSQAELWLSGRLTIEQPWVERAPWPAAEYSFAPLGYHPGKVPGTITPTYSAGLPMLMALAKLVGGHCAMFWVVPLAGAAFVFATFGIGRRLAGDAAGFIAAWLLATSPPFLFMLVAPMSDVPTAAAWTVAFWCLTLATVRGAAFGGLAAAIAVLIRPNLIPMLALIVVWFLIEAWRRGEGRRRHLQEAAVFVWMLLPGIVITALLNSHWHGSPLISGYGTFTEIFSLTRVAPNIRHYASWLAETHTPFVFLGIVALFLPASWLWRSARGRVSVVAALGAFVAAVWIEYGAYMTFGAWWDLRFLLPTIGFTLVGLGALLVSVTDTRVAQSSTRAYRLAGIAVAFAVLLLGLHGVNFVVRQHVFDQQRMETKYTAAAAVVRSRTDPNAVIFSGLHSGSLRYYAGRTTLTYFNLEAEWLDRAIAWLHEHGAHPYALLEEPEISDFRKRFASANALGMKPMVFYDGTAKIYLFDLLAAPGATSPTETVVDHSPDVRCVAPAEPPSLTLR